MNSSFNAPLISIILITESLICHTPFKISDLEGMYSDAGYGTLTLRSEQNSPDEKVLVADRPDMTWMYGLRFRHIFGDQ